MNWKEKLTALTLSMKSSMIRELVEMTQNVPGIISFAGGFPSPLTFPKEQLAEIYKEIIMQKGDTVLQYGPTGGDLPVKEAIIKEDKLDISPDEIQVCCGATNGIYNAVRTFIEPGDNIIAEAPSFLGSLVAFEAAGANIMPVSMEADGMDIDELSHIIANNDTGKIKFIYTIPDFQNPTGITMSTEKRERLVELAIENDILIIEDDPYGKLRLTGESYPSILEIARDKFFNKSVVICVRSFSKLLGPGMRIAYTIADKGIISFMNSWAQKVNVTNDRISQNVVAAYLEKGLLAGQIENIKQIYKPLCNSMVAAVREYIPANIKWIEPEGGMFLWLELPEGANTDELFKKAIKKKVAFIPGSKFYPSGCEKYNGMRLNFSYPTAEQIETGIKRLSEVL